MSVGRTDLATGNSVVQMNTLNMLKKMKVDYKIYPGHENSTTLFYEKKYNPYMK
jgi:glyoxylase-like metal-dependent hydrolase (beta-lactamase superfamily II)